MGAQSSVPHPHAAFPWWLCRFHPASPMVSLQGAKTLLFLLLAEPDGAGEGRGKGVAAAWAPPCTITGGEGGSGDKKKIYLHKAGAQRGVLGRVKAGGAGLGLAAPVPVPVPLRWQRHVRTPPTPPSCQLLT